MDIHADDPSMSGAWEKQSSSYTFSDGQTCFYYLNPNNSYNCMRYSTTDNDWQMGASPDQSAFIVNYRKTTLYGNWGDGDTAFIITQN